MYFASLQTHFLFSCAGKSQGTGPVQERAWVRGQCRKEPGYEASAGKSPGYEASAGKSLGTRPVQERARVRG